MKYIQIQWVGLRRTVPGTILVVVVVFLAPSQENVTVLQSDLLSFPTSDPPELSVSEDRVSVEEGGNVSIPCLYRDKLKSAEKKWCESGNLHSCISVLTTGPPQKPSVTIVDDGSGVFTVTLMELERKDTGWYWCSAGDFQVPVHINVTESLDAFHNSTGEGIHFFCPDFLTLNLKCGRMIFFSDLDGNSLFS